MSSLGRWEASAWVTGFFALALLARTGRAEEPETVSKNGEPSRTLNRLTDLSLEQLANLEVTSVSKRSEKLSDAPAAIFVITQEDIRRSGVTSLPEALRMAPGLEVARVDAQSWAISSRGFNDAFANKLLVLMDGRSVYTPLFSGVYWDMQDTLLEDVDRIEVVRGPGATLWGANAVNGVINVITKTAKDTTGWLVSGGAGTEDRGFGSVRYGMKLSDAAWLRVYGKYFNRDDSALVTGTAAEDSYQQGRAGFRLDLEPSPQDTFTLQGEGFAGREEDFNMYSSVIPPYQREASGSLSFNGGHLLGRWTHSFADTSELQFQTYYDRALRDGFTLGETRDTYDADLSYRFRWGQRHNFVCGLGYRLSSDMIRNSSGIILEPQRRTTQLVNTFVQDEIALVPDRLHLTLGSKFEHNDYTGFEIQPGARLSWKPHERQTVWAAVTRAVRTPSRVEADGRINSVVLPPGPPGPPVSSGAPIPLQTAFFGSQNFLSEKLLAYELGYRVQPMDQLSLDFAAFYNDYEELRSLQPGTPGVVLAPAPHVLAPFNIGNSLYGETYGFEGLANLRLTDWWRVQATYTLLKMHLHTRPGSGDTTSESIEGQSPQQQAGLRLGFDLPGHLELDGGVRYVDRLPAFNIDSYFGLDARLAWRPTKHLEISVVGQNLAYPQRTQFHPSSFVPTPVTQIERAVYAKITLRF